MSHRSKREVAPPARETPATSLPLWGAAMNPNIPFPQPGQAMVPPPGWWTAHPPQSNSFFPPYGPLMGSVPTSNVNGNLETSTNSVECLPGGFQSLLQNGMKSSMVPPNEPITQNAALGSKRKTVINIDEGEDVRTEKRLAWIPEDDKRLVSAWIFHSNDPISGNGKKNDHYWGDLHADYNTTVPPNRKRKVKHLRDRFQKIKRWVGLFCGSWAKATSIYTSGQSDDQLKEKALQFYLDDYKEGPFTVMHCWEIMKDERKWLALLDELEGSNKMKLNDEREVEDNIKKAEGNSEKERPIGTKQAKKQRIGKGKGKAKDNEFEEDMKKYMDIQAAATKRHEEFLETQQRVSDAKVEAAKLRKEAAILESYKTLMSMDTSNMDEEMKAEHKLGLKILREKMVGNAN